ncbi:MAG: anti-sigma factor antagonist [Clostridiales bacterium]|jgi:stage II sporulation protein AA (anti-sigma F factor antagonist)|nr:anti-sigma factor antagonist [Clostridiales bacterium]
MRVDSKILNKTLYIGLTGELDEHAADYTKAELDSLTNAAPMQRVVIDLSGLSFMDSAGVGVLIGRFKKLKARSVPVFLANPAPQTDKVLRMSGIYQIMPLV